MKAARRFLSTGIPILFAAVLPAQTGREPTVGMSGRLDDLVLPGAELAAAPIDLASPVVVRVVAARPHGTAFRYDLEYTGLEAGTFDLRERLVRKDGSSIEGLPPIPVTVRSLLPPGQVTPRRPAPGVNPSLGGYMTWLVAGGIAWTAGLLAIVFAGRRRRAAAAASARPLTLADRLRPLVEQARAGTLPPEARAGLELALVAFWRRKLRLEDRPPSEVLPLLRRHAEAGPLLAGLEAWLHRPASPADLDVAALLAPYRDLRPEELDGAPAGS